MSYNNEPGQGAVFHNRDKEPGDNRPALKGKARCPCCSADLQVAVWKREGKDGKPAWYSLRLQEQGSQSRSQQQNSSNQQSRQVGYACTKSDTNLTQEDPPEQVDPEFNDSIPF